MDNAQARQALLLQVAQEPIRMHGLRREELLQQQPVCAREHIPARLLPVLQDVLPQEHSQSHNHLRLLQQLLSRRPRAEMPMALLLSV
jgi:hypothetical protein